MSKKEITLTYYHIKNMGIYSKKGETFLTPIKLMKELKNWGYDTKRPLIETSTYSENKKFLESYCLDFHEDSGDYIIGLWNKLPTSKNGVGSVSATSTSGDALVVHTKIGKNNIPGFPSYFFISPSKSIIATIKLDNHVLGISQFKSYIKGYLRHFCTHIVDRNEDKEEIYGLCTEAKPIGIEDKRFPDKQAYHSFHMPILKQTMGEEFLLKNAINVTKIVKDISTEMLLQDKNETSIEQLVRCVKGLPITKKKSTRVSIPVELTYTHVEHLIKEYHENDGSSEYNVGFILRGDGQKIHWLDGTAMTNTIEGDVKMQSQEQPDLESLMGLIKKLGHVKIELEERESAA